MLKQWKRTRGLLAAAAALALAVFLVLPPAATGDKPDSPPGQDKKKPPPEEPVPPGPGLIAVNDSGWIVIMNADGSGLSPVAATDSAGNKFGPHWRKPAWSPMFSDLRVKLAFPQRTATGHALMVVNVFPDVGTLVPVLEVADGGIFQVDWSPAELLEGERESVRVCFSTWEDLYDLDLRRQVIHIVNLIYDPAAGVFVVDPAAPEPLVLDPGPGSDYWQARFSPDGEWLALARIDSLPDGSTNQSIWLANSDGTNQQVLIDGPSATDWYPAWSADGSQLAFISSRDGRDEIYVASLGEGEAMEIVSIERVTNSKNVSEGWPTWSPDGLQIGYQAPGKPNVGLIGKVIVATGEQFKLAEGQWPDWSP